MGNSFLGSNLSARPANNGIERVGVDWHPQLMCLQYPVFMPNVYTTIKVTMKVIRYVVLVPASY